MTRKIPLRGLRNDLLPILRLLIRDNAYLSHFYTTVSMVIMINIKAEKKERFIDLTSLLGDKSHISYICKEWGTDLILDTEYQVKNPFTRGKG